MQDTRAARYAEGLAQLIREETVSVAGQTDRTKFYRFQDTLRRLFPRVTEACEWTDFDGSFLLRWRGRSDASPLMLMNHHDVVEAPGAWRYPPFAGTVAEGRVWGRGTLDTKGGLWAMLQAAEELIAEGVVPPQDVYFLSACTEETDGTGADAISRALEARGVRFAVVLDEGGMIVKDPLDGVHGSYAMIGVGEKGCADLRFVARSEGGHASTPPRNTPLVRLGRFMAAVDKGRLFKADISPTVAAMFRALSRSMTGVLRPVLAHSRLLKPLLCRIAPSVSDAANAMLRTTVAFTMGAGSDGVNVLPQEAWVMGDMRYSHHQGFEASLAAVNALAARYHIEVEVLQRGVDSPLTDHKSRGFAAVENTVRRVFPEVNTTPYVMTGASDCRFMSRVCDCCLRFSPFTITDEQLESIHGINEYVDVEALPPAVDFYRAFLTEEQV